MCDRDLQAHTQLYTKTHMRYTKGNDNQKGSQAINQITRPRSINFITRLRLQSFGTRLENEPRVPDSPKVDMQYETKR